LDVAWDAAAAQLDDESSGGLMFGDLFRGRHRGVGAGLALEKVHGNGSACAVPQAKRSESGAL
jgi:hypothetical protein